MNSQLMTNATMPKLNTENGSAIICVNGLIEALISAMNRANATMPSTGGCPTTCRPGSSSTVTATATLIMNQRLMKCPMTPW